jgi:K+-sensing histidine kinase KdpD
MDTAENLMERTTKEEVKQEIAAVLHDPLMDSFLKIIPGLLAVLNEHRQIVAINDDFIRHLGLDSSVHILGIRPGEALNCVHAHEGPGGCGTSPFCSSCGAAIAIAAGLATDGPAERCCAISSEQNGIKEDLYLKIRVQPMNVSGQRYLLLFVQDISAEQRWKILEQTFFHDITNLAAIIIGQSEMLVSTRSQPPPELAHSLLRTSTRLAGELAFQRELLHSRSSHIQPVLEMVSGAQILRDLRKGVDGHPAARGKSFSAQINEGDIRFKTDPTLLQRILANMLTNAFEASQDGDEVRLKIGKANGRIVFSVWNRQPIPETVALRVFQRNFSTKGGLGRGLGTFSMKLLGEQALDGQVGFTSSPEQGTTFQIALPG